MCTGELRARQSRDAAAVEEGALSVYGWVHYERRSVGPRQQRLQVFILALIQVRVCLEGAAVGGSREWWE